MHPLIENFMERPKSHKIGAWVGTLILVGGVFWQYFYGPASTQLSELEDKKVTLASQVTNEKRIARDLPKFQEQVKNLQIKLKIALSELPDQKEIPELLRSVSDLAKDTGLNVSLFRPEPEIKREFFAEVPVFMTIEGTYHQIATFFDEVGRMSRIVNMKGIDMREPKNTDHGMAVKADCVATTFRYLDDSERVQPDTTVDKKKRRRQ